MGKGSSRRPKQISDEEMDRRWAETFGLTKHDENRHGEECGRRHEEAPQATDGLEAQKNKLVDD